MMDGSKRIFRSNDAETDLSAIWQFGAEEWTPDMADKTLASVPHPFLA